MQQQRSQAMISTSCVKVTEASGTLKGNIFIDVFFLLFLRHVSQDYCYTVIYCYKSSTLQLHIHIYNNLLFNTQAEL